MTVTEQFVVAILEVCGKKARPTRMLSVHNLLENFFKARMLEYIQANHPELVAQAEAEQVN